MVGWLIYSVLEVEKNKRYIQFYLDEGKRLNLDIQLILVEDLMFGVKDNMWFMTYKKEVIKYPEFVICRTIYPLLTKQFEFLGIPVFNNSQIAEICNDKAKTYQYVAQLGIQMVDSAFCKYPMIEGSLEHIAVPTVIKAVAGHGGSQVFLLDPGESTHVECFNADIGRELDGSDVVMQPLIGSRHQDLRVYIIGNEIIGSILRTAKEGFKSNFSLGGEVTRYDLSSGEIQLVKRIMTLFDIGMVGIDFIIGDEGQLVFNEIEDVAGARMLYQCMDINLAALYLNYIRARLLNEKNW
ncbi:MAG: ATP-grasp domain-containing protein [Anaerocolumna sp.]